jgi:hypothetical protein
MHRTLKAEATKRARLDLIAQQARFDEWRREFNEVRPHEALGQKTPASYYEPSARRYPEAKKCQTQSIRPISRRDESTTLAIFAGNEKPITSAGV